MAKEKKKKEAHSGRYHPHTDSYSGAGGVLLFGISALYDYAVYKEGEDEYDALADHYVKEENSRAGA